MKALLETIKRWACWVSKILGKCPDGGGNSLSPADPPQPIGGKQEKEPPCNPLPLPENEPPTINTESEDIPTQPYLPDLTNGDDESNDKNLQPVNPLPPPPIKPNRQHKPKNSDSLILKGDDQKPNPTAKKYEMYCTEIQGAWCVVFKNLGKEDFRQQEEPLNYEKKNRCLLSDLSHSITDAKGKLIQPLFDDKIPLIFKFFHTKKNAARLVKQITNGMHVVIAPADWTRKGRPRIESALCHDEKFKAHFFPGADEIGEDGFTEYPSLFSERFSLIGEFIYDSAASKIFTGSPPILEDTDNWQGVSWVRVYQKGEKGKWEHDFCPTKETLDTSLANKTGRFFVRIYDESLRKITDLEFRYFPALKQILVDNKEFSSHLIVPPCGGHVDAKVRFVDVDGRNIHLELAEKNNNILVNNDGSVNIKPHIDGDFTEWNLKENEESINIQIALPRVWWRLDEEEQWCDTPMCDITRENFRARRDESIKIRVPIHVKKVLAGFNGERDKPAPVRYIENDRNYGEATFSMREFVFNEHVMESSPDKAELQIECENWQNSVVSIICVQGVVEKTEEKEQPPTGGALVPVCRSSGIWCKAKGFSRKELCEADITIEQARIRKIRVDSRRKTMYDKNIVQLSCQTGGHHAKARRD